MTSADDLANQLSLSNLANNGELPTDQPGELSVPPVAEARDTPPTSGGHVEAKGFDPPSPPPPNVQDLVITTSPPPSVASTAAPSVGAPSASSSSTDLTSTLSKIQSVVDRHLDLVTDGRLEQLPDHVVQLMDRMFEHHRQNRGRTPAFQSGSSSGGGSSSSGGKAPRHGNHRGGGGNSRRPVRKERPRCTHPTCDKPLGHTTATCFQKKREEAATERNRRRNQPTAKRPCAEDRTPRSKDASTDDDE
ncbi:unnamed protein product [Ectocarpus sp. CCAP 1310/34]|nr:unnamed protein product [Ectocarpus sp. CCAP 1310/34]